MPSFFLDPWTVAVCLKAVNRSGYRDKAATLLAKIEALVGNFPLADHLVVSGLVQRSRGDQLEDDLKQLESDWTASRPPDGTGQSPSGAKRSTGAAGR